MNRAMSVFWYL